MIKPMQDASELEKLIKGKYKSIEELPYRQGVIGIVINDKNEYLVVQMVDYAENQWRFPGGGLDEGETHQDALLRELKEELNSDKFEIINESNQVNKYDWPEFVIAEQIRNKNRYFRGQEQKQFLVKFTGTPGNIKIEPKELRQVKWIPYKQLKSHFVFDGQWAQAEGVLKELRQK